MRKVAGYVQIGTDLSRLVASCTLGQWWRWVFVLLPARRCSMGVHHASCFPSTTVSAVSNSANATGPGFAPNAARARETTHLFAPGAMATRREIVHLSLSSTEKYVSPTPG